MCGLNWCCLLIADATICVHIYIHVGSEDGTYTYTYCCVHLD